MRGLRARADAADHAAKTAADNTAERCAEAAAARIVILRDDVGEQNIVSRTDLAAADI